MDNSDHKDGILVVRSQSELNQAIREKERLMALIYASWCPYCIGFLPVFRKYAQGREGFLLVEDDRWEIADQYGVEVVPTALYFEEGKLVKRLDGALGVGLREQDLAEFIKACGW